MRASALVQPRPKMLSETKWTRKSTRYYTAATQYSRERVANHCGCQTKADAYEAKNKA